MREDLLKGSAEVAAVFFVRTAVAVETRMYLCCGATAVCWCCAVLDMLLVLVLRDLQGGGICWVGGSAERSAERSADFVREYASSNGEPVPLRTILAFTP